MATTSVDPFKPGVTEEDEVRHCKEDALGPKAFERFFEATYAIEDEYYRLQAQFVVIAAARLGLRAGEIVHLEADWVNWDEKRIEIPRYQPCEMGRGGGICANCDRLARQRVDHNDGLPLELARTHQWHPKTENAIRGVPFDFSARVEHVVERFCDRFDGFPVSYQSLKRRIDRVQSHADGFEHRPVYAHALRATAASHVAGLGIGVLGLKSFMGWSQLSTAEAYIVGNDRATQRELHSIHGR